MRQYRATDLFLFAAIFVVFDLLSHFAAVLLPEAAMYMFALTVPMVVLVMMRWGWWSVFFAVGDGLLLTVLNSPAVWQNYLIYGIGHAAILLLLIPLHYIGKQKIAGKWYLSALLVILAWILMNLAITVLQTVFGGDFVQSFLANIGFGLNGLLALALGIVIILVLRRLDGMFEDQVHYLKRLDNERKELMRADEYGEEPIEISEDTLSILRKRDKDLE